MSEKNDNLNPGSEERPESESIESRNSDQEKPIGGDGDADDQLLKFPAFAKKLKGLFKEMRETRGGDDASPEMTAGRVIDDFRIVGEIGSGGMARVYEAEQISLNRRVALKVLYPHLTLSDLAIRKFRREAEAGGRQSHPGIVSVYAVGEHDGVHYIAQELVEGARTLAHMLEAYRTETALPRGYFRDMAKYIVAVAEALHHAHTMGVVHRDVKPSNILIDSSGRPMISDFGLAKVEDALALSRTGDFSGTPYYMSPEQAMGGHSGLDQRTDVYSLGVTLYESLTLERPFNGKTSHEVIRQISTCDPEEPVKVNPRVPRDLSVICMKAMEKEPARRYPSAEAMAEDLHRFLTGDVILARPAGWTDKLVKRVKRNPVVSIALAVALLSFVALLCLTPWYLWRLSDERNNALESKEVASRRYEEMRRLSDDKLLSDYLDEVETLWPAHPEKVADMEAWLIKTGELIARLDLHRQTLDTLRRDALPYDEEARQHDRKIHPDAANLEKIVMLQPMLDQAISRTEAQRDALDNLENADEIANLENRLKGMRDNKTELEKLRVQYETEVGKRITWKFEGYETQWQHDILEGLVKGLEGISEDDGFIKKIEERLDFARTLRRKTIDDYETEWAISIKAVADKKLSPHYEGLRIEPQVGLVPLGPDPNSGLYEFGHFQTGAIPARDDSGRLMIEESNCLIFVLLPGGSFMMGAERPGQNRTPNSPNVDPNAYSYEGPVREVTIPPFFISKFEMSQAQWKRFTGSNPSGYTPSSRSKGSPITLIHPVEQVEWFECEKILFRLKLRLPSESEWEYAARGGSSTVWFTGNKRESLSGHANLADSFYRRNEGPPHIVYDLWLDDGYFSHAPVNTLSPNAFGLHHMVGNVWEWCQDGYMPRYNECPVDGSAYKALDDSHERVIRGGAFNTCALLSRSSYRKWMDPGSRERYCGIRPACSLETR